MYATFGSQVYGMARRLEIVSAPDGGKGRIVAALNAVFYCYKAVWHTGKQGYQVEFGIVDAVGAGADNETLYLRVGKCFGIYVLEFVDGCKGVRIGLEVSEVALSVAVAVLMKLYSFVELLGYAFMRRAV